jgi:hypothetical protein
VRDLLAGVNDGDTVTLVSQGGAAPGATRTFDVVHRSYSAPNSSTGFTSIFTGGWSHFLRAHRLEVGQVVAFELLKRRGGRVVLGTCIMPPTRPGRLCVSQCASYQQSLTIQFVNDMLAGVHHCDKVTLVGAGGAGSAAPLTFDVTYTGRIRNSQGTSIMHCFQAGWPQFVKAHALEAGQVIDFERAGRRSGRPGGTAGPARPADHSEPYPAPPMSAQ